MEAIPDRNHRAGRAEEDTLARADAGEQILLDLSTDETGLLVQIGSTASTLQNGTGGARSGTTSKAMLRDELMSGLRGLNRTAATIAGANGTV